MTDPRLLRRLVERYYANEATAEELAVFAQLLQEGLLDDVLNEYLDEQIAEKSQEPGNSEKGWLLRRHFWKYAAAVGLLLISGYLLTISYPTKEDYITVQTDQYKEKKIELSDGSIVTLNRNSEFTYPKKWTGLAREVKLESGEAYFQITKNKDYKSFIVHMPDELEIDVLGTAFNVTSRKGETRVYLETGELEIDCEGKNAHLKPGDLAYFNASTKELEVKEGNADASLAWKDNMFFFDDAPLSEVAETLKDFYHTDIVIENNSRQGLRFTGKMSRADMNAVLTIISRTLQIEVKADSSRVGRVGAAPDPPPQLSD